MSVSFKAIKRYACKTLKLERYFRHPGDGRTQGEIPASVLSWTQVVGHLLRESSFLAMEKLSKFRAGRAFGVARKFGDDALGYFTERLAPEPTRRALAQVLTRAKRNKAFDGSHFIGYALDGTGTGCCPHDSDCAPSGPNWQIKLTELLRLIQFYTSGNYHICPGAAVLALSELNVGYGVTNLAGLGVYGTGLVSLSALRGKTALARLTVSANPFLTDMNGTVSDLGRTGDFPDISSYLVVLRSVKLSH